MANWDCQRRHIEIRDTAQHFVGSPRYGHDTWDTQRVIVKARREHRLSDPTDAEVFCLEVFVEALVRAFPADA